MKARRNCLIIRAFNEQKESHEVTMADGSKVNLFLGRKYSENDRESNPNVCDIISVGDGIEDLFVGDKIIVHHNVVKNEATHLGRKDGYTTLSVPYNHLIYAKIKEDGEIVPLKGTIIAERIARKKLSEFDITECTEPMKFKVVSVPDGYNDVLPSQNILCYKLSDYEVIYHYNNRECKAIRILQDDIIGVFTD